jgi:hypothetical protein
MAEHKGQHDEKPESPLENEGLKEYAAGVVPSTAAEMDAVLEQLEAERDDFPPPDGREDPR